MKKTKKLLILLALTSIIFALFVFFLERISKPDTNLQFGVSFSPIYATYLGLDWKDTYKRMFEDLNIKRVRVPTYWTTTEHSNDIYDYSDIDFMLNVAGQNSAKVLLVLGLKQPRWPECHIPVWAKNLSLRQRQQKMLTLIKNLLDRYRSNDVIWGWQVENEPLFGFGESCDKADLDFLKQEAQLVRSLDPSRPVVISDSGEWSLWVNSMQLSDILGISLYRYANIEGYGYLSYTFPKIFYMAKSYLIRKLFAPYNTKTIIVELQTEPWLKQGVLETSLEEQTGLLPLDKLKGNINFAKKAGFSEIYLWGVEWWYYLEMNGHSEYLKQIQSALWYITIY